MTVRTYCFRGALGNMKYEVKYEYGSHKEFSWKHARNGNTILTLNAQIFKMLRYKISDFFLCTENN